MKPIILPYKGVHPKISPLAFIAPGAAIIGDVTIGAGCSIWFGCVIRGDVEPVMIGERTNVQDGTVIHVTRNGHPTRIGSGVTIGHKSMIHACTLQDGCFIGMSATILDDVTVETGAQVAAGAVVSPGKTVPKGEIWAGVPAKLLRQMKQSEIDFIPVSAANYALHAEEYLAEINKLQYSVIASEARQPKK